MSRTCPISCFGLKKITYSYRYATAAVEYSLQPVLIAVDCRPSMRMRVRGHVQAVSRANGHLSHLVTVWTSGTTTLYVHIIPSGIYKICKVVFCRVHIYFYEYGIYQICPAVFRYFSTFHISTRYCPYKYSVDCSLVPPTCVDCKLQVASCK